MAVSKIFTIFFAFCAVTSLCCKLNESIKARYDNYKLIRVSLETDEHVKVFQELEEESDSFIFYGHALSHPQQLTILVSGNKWEFDFKFKFIWIIIEKQQKLSDSTSCKTSPNAFKSATLYWWEKSFYLITHIECRCLISTRKCCSDCLPCRKKIFKILSMPSHLQWSQHEHRQMSSIGSITFTSKPSTRGWTRW